jgi:oligopeptide/dipeptide ABC transporter ATP-binding protein
VAGGADRVRPAGPGRADPPRLGPDGPAAGPERPERPVVPVLPVLDVEGLTIRYGARLAAWNVALTLDAGEVLGLVGESGAGKSSVARAVARLLPEGGRLVAGRVRLAGRDVTAAAEREVRRLRGAVVALVPQDPLSALNPAFRVGLQATDALRLHRGLSRRQAEAEMARLLGRLGLPEPAEVLRRFPHELSGGMRQRVLLAMAFSCAPALLVADEPTTALDVTTQAQILRLLEGLRAEHGVAVLFVTHDLGVVAHVAHRVAVMYAGCVVEVAPTAALFRTPGHPYTAALLRQAPRLDQPPGEPAGGPEEAMPVLHGPPGACPFLGRCPRREARCEAAMPDLEARGPGHLVACWAGRPDPAEAAPRRAPVSP